MADCETSALSREERIAKIRFMDTRGIFQLKGSIEQVAFLHHGDGTIGVKLPQEVLTADFVVLAIGVRPDTAFLQDSGIKLGERGH